MRKKLIYILKKGRNKNFQIVLYENIFYEKTNQNLKKNVSMEINIFIPVNYTQNFYPKQTFKKKKFQRKCGCGLLCPLNLYAFTPKVWPLQRICKSTCFCQVLNGWILHAYHKAANHLLTYTKPPNNQSNKPSTNHHHFNPTHQHHKKIPQTSLSHKNNSNFFKKKQSQIVDTQIFTIHAFRILILIFITIHHCQKLSQLSLFSSFKNPFISTQSELYTHITQKIFSEKKNT
eukprot:TRINITY_DN37182_c0_g1_i3.p2 TRINITY_DN37182_c0_g1~~TRINITY_DN37182_c0_g1_i3.p2  ORF type:complete len:232 (+),score=-3.59 TRINITY_DN37182_c0_g1_i3:1153-1848(+)